MLIILVSRQYSEKVLHGHINLIKKRSDLLKKGWIINREGLYVYITMYEWKRDGTNQKYMLRLKCDGYPVKPPSAIFVNPKTKKNDISCWPARNHFFPNWKGDLSWICFNKLREFNEIYPNECRWNGSGYAADTILDIIAFVQDMIDYN